MGNHHLLNLRAYFIPHLFLRIHIAFRKCFLEEFFIEFRLFHAVDALHLDAKVRFKFGSRFLVNIKQVRYLMRPIFFECLVKIDGYFVTRSEEHTSELQSLMRISYAVFCLKKKKKNKKKQIKYYK